MKYILSLMLILVFVTGCSQKKKTEPVKKNELFKIDSTSLKTTKIADTNQLITLGYKLEEDKVYKYRMTTITKSKQVIKADTTITQDVNQVLTYIAEIQTSNIDNYGVMEIKFNISNIKLDAIANGKNYHYQSGVTKDSSELFKYSDYESMINNPFTVRINKKGELVEIFRTDRILNKLLAIQGYTDSLNANQKKKIQTNLVEGILKPLVFRIFRKLPTEKMRIKHTWKSVQPTSKFMVFLLNTTYNFKLDTLMQYKTDKIAKIVNRASTKVKGNNKFTEKGVSYKFSKPKTSSYEEIFFNVTKGYIQKAKRNTNLEIFFEMNAKTKKLNKKGSKRTILENKYLLELISG